MDIRGQREGTARARTGDSGRQHACAGDRMTCTTTIDKLGSRASLDKLVARRTSATLRYMYLFEFVFEFEFGRSDAVAELTPEPKAVLARC